MGQLPEDVSPAVAIRRSRTGNIPTRRLLARRDRLAVDTMLNSRQFPTRKAFVDRAAEMVSVENELDRRGAQTEVRFSDRFPS